VVKKHRLSHIESLETKLPKCLPRQGLVIRVPNFSKFSLVFFLA
jgi:hypothetical protein